jgi:hypothetical protein
VRRVDLWEALHVSIGVFNPIQDHRPIREMQLPSAVVQHTRRAATCTRSFYLGIEMRHGDLSGFANLPGWRPGFANTEMEALSCHWRSNFGRDSRIMGACNLIRLCAIVLSEAVSLQMLRAATGRSVGSRSDVIRKLKQFRVSPIERPPASAASRYSAKRIQAPGSLALGWNNSSPLIL